MGAAAAECPAPGAGEQCQNPLLEVRETEAR